MQPLKKSSPVAPELKDKIIAAGKRVLRIESESVADLMDRIDSTFVDVVSLLDDCPGHLVVLGIGKSGLVGTENRRDLLQHRPVGGIPSRGGGQSW